MNCVSGERLAAALASRRPELWDSNPRLAERIGNADQGRPACAPPGTMAAKPKRETALRSSILTVRQVSETEAPRPYITASEVGDFTYCPENWYLRRFGHSPDANAMQRLRDGRRQHERIGRTTERIVDADALRRGLLIIIVALAALLLATSAGLLRLPGPLW